MKTTNTAQELYMLAKANLEALREKEHEVERQYIAEHGIVNSDGSIPSRIYCIDDANVFERANAEVSKMEEDSGLWADILAAEDALEAAENVLIEYGLSLVPMHEREILSKAAATNITTRKKIIGLVLRLDVSTVR